LLPGFWAGNSGLYPNDLWCADYKGAFQLGDGRYCYPLTVTEHASRSLMMCEAHESAKEVNAFDAFVSLFAGQRLGIKEVEKSIWLLSFMHYDLGYIDLEQRTLQTIDNPCLARDCHPCLRCKL
jgi:hypothetical protein